MLSDSDYAISAVSSDSDSVQSQIAVSVQEVEDLALNQNTQNNSDTASSISSDDGLSISAAKPAPLKQSGCGVRSVLFGKKGACIIPAVGIEHLRGKSYRYNPKLPDAETLLSGIETAKAHFLVYHVLSTQLIAEGYTNFTHKRVCVQKHLLTSFSGPVSSRQLTQHRLALKCLQTLLEHNPNWIDNHKDGKV